MEGSNEARAIAPKPNLPKLWTKARNLEMKQFFLLERGITEPDLGLGSMARLVSAPTQGSSIDIMEITSSIRCEHNIK